MECGLSPIEAPRCLDLRWVKPRIPPKSFRPCVVLHGRLFGECVLVDELVPEVGIEPTLSFLNQILSLARLPVSPLRLG